MQNRKKKKDTDLQNILLDSVGEGEGGMFQENSIETKAYPKRLQGVTWRNKIGISNTEDKAFIY